MSEDAMAAEFAIRQLHARYADAVWRKDFEAYRACFAEDAEWRLAGVVMQGRDYIAGRFKSDADKFIKILMTFRSPIVDVSDGQISSRTYVTEENVFLDGTPKYTIGIYYDRFVRVDGALKFKWRMFQTQYTGPFNYPMKFQEVADYGAPPALPPLDAPTFPSVQIPYEA